MELSQRIKNITPSQTLAITAKSRDLKAQGVDVISLSAGEPDFNTPDEIIEKENAIFNKLPKSFDRHVTDRTRMLLLSASRIR